MKLFFSFICILVLASCGQTNKEVVESGEQCSTDTSKRELGLGQASELAEFMRHMDKALASVKKSLKSGEVPHENLDFEAILRATPTKTGITDDADYQAYAMAFLANVGQMDQVPIDSLAIQHNLVINSCIACHNSFCTGPIARIKKHLVNPENIKVEK